MARRLVVTTLLLVLAVPIAAAKPNFAKTYKATLDWQKGAGGRNWVAGPEDVWRLSKFTYRFQDLDIRAGACTVVFGHHGTNVVWGVLIAEEPGSVRKKEFGEETIETIWMRFNPALVGKLFPKKTVVGPGTLKALLAARRVCSSKINGCWQAENTPVIPWKHSVIFDIDTTTGVRRYYAVDTKKKSVHYEPAFAGRPVPLAPDEPITKIEALGAYDRAWTAFDEHYPMFGLRPDVDWDRLKPVYGKLAEEAETRYEAAGAIALLTTHLRDLHVWVKAGESWLPGYNRCRLLNANFKHTKARIGTISREDRDLVWGRTEDRIGYIAVMNLSNSGLPTAVDQALEALADTWGLVLDLRFNGGGGENLAIEIAGRFHDRERVYSTNRYRGGKKRDQLGPTLDRKCGPRGPWRYRGPVMCLVGQKTMSSAESFALMMAQCPQVTTVGDRTAGSSANPRRESLPGGITVNVPRWLDMDPKGKPIDENGYTPDIHIETRLDDYRDADPVIDTALKKLRKTPKSKRRPGRKKK